MADVLSVAVVGAGGIGQAHLKAIAAVETTRLAAVMDVDADRARQAAATYGGKACTRFEEVLEDPSVQAVHLCTPHNAHADQAVLAAAAGKHVLVEKPMALSVADCDRMIQACERADKVLMVGQVMRYWAINRQARELIRSGRIGQPGHLMRRRLSYFHPTSGGAFRHWYADVNVGGVCVLYCFGPHEYDILPWYLDSPVTRVYAQGNESTEFYRGQKDSYTAVLNHTNGAVSVLSQSVSSHAGAHDQFIIGSEGSLKLTTQELWLNGEPVPVEEGTSAGMSNQVREFARCCLEGGEPDASGRSVRHSMAVIEAAKLSAERNAVVELAEFDP